MTQSAVRLDILEGNVALLTLDQPGSRANTLGQAVQDDLERVLGELDALHKRVTTEKQWTAHVAGYRETVEL